MSSRDLYRSPYGGQVERRSLHRGGRFALASLALMLSVLAGAWATCPPAGASAGLDLAPAVDPGPAANVTVSFSPSTIAANGASPTTATAKVTDAGGNPVAGNMVAFMSSDAGEHIGAVTDKGNGTYTTTITSSTTAGPVTVTATDESVVPGVSGQGTLYQYGTASSVSVSLNPPSIVANGSSIATATATVTDARSDPVPGRSVTIASDSGNHVGSVTDNGDGTYSAAITSTTLAGPVTITATDDTNPSSTFSGKATLTQTAGVAKTVTVSVVPASIIADGSSSTVASAVVTDANGNGVPADDVRFSTNDSGNRFSGFSSDDKGSYSVTITSSMTVHAITVNATDFSPATHVSGKTTLTQTVGPATAVSVSLSPTSIVANGTSTSTATATVTDAEGHPVAGDGVAFSSTDGGQRIGAVTDHHNGHYTAVITSSKTLGSTTITGTDDSATPHVYGTAALTQRAGPAAHVGVSLAPSSIVADRSSTSVATATVTDAEGHSISSDKVAFSSSDGGERIGPVTDHHDGTYTATITSSTALGPVTITATDSSPATAVAGKATLTQTVGPASAVAVSLSPSSIIANGSSTSTATATVTDAEGHPVKGDDVGFSGSDGGERIGVVTNHHDGTYTATVRSSTTVGKSTITATDSTPSPAVSRQATLIQTVGPATKTAVSLAPSAIVANGASTARASAAVTDAEGHPLSGEAVTFSSSDRGDRIGAVTDHGDGTYTATITSSTTVGKPTITATDSSPAVPVSGTATLTETVGLAAHVSVSMAPGSIVADGSATTTATATVTDAEGHPIAGDKLLFSSSDSGDGIGAVTDHGDGTYTATITSSTTIGQPLVTATDDSPSPHISGSATLTQTIGQPSSVTVSLASSSIVAGGSATTTATATVTDAVGHPIPGDVVSFSSSDGGEAIGGVTDNGNGSYTATITSSAAVGTSTITATDSSPTTPVSGSATLTQTTGPVASVTISLAPTTIVADGASTTMATVVVGDASGHPLPSQAVAIQTSDPADGVAAARDNEDGSYSATITSSTTVHTVTVTAIDFSSSPTVSGSTSLVQVDGPAASITLSFKPSSLVADGSATDAVSATVIDAAGHPLAGQHVSFSSSDSGQRIGPVSDHGDGTYSAKITSSRRAHAVTITAKDTSVFPVPSVSAILLQTAPPNCRVPALRGKTRSQVRRALRTHRCAAAEVTVLYRGSGTVVVRQSIKAGKAVRMATLVLRLGKPSTPKG